MMTPTDPIPEFKLGADRYARREPVGTADSSPAAALDTETLEVVQTFEALYAELSSAAPGPTPEEARVNAADDDLVIDLPPGMEPPPRRPAAPSAVTMLRPTSAGPRPLPARSAINPASLDEEKPIPLDDAFAMLREAESRGRANAERDARDEETRHSTVPPPASRPPALKSSRPPSASLRPAPRTESDWTGRARALWPKVLAAAIVALIVGTGVGYIAGKSPRAGPAHATIPLNAQGGTRLQFDYELDRR